MYIHGNFFCQPLCPHVPGTALSEIGQDSQAAELQDRTAPAYVSAAALGTALLLSDGALSGIERFSCCQKQLYHTIQISIFHSELCCD